MEREIENVDTVLKHFELNKEQLAECIDNFFLN